ncbi:glycine receptor subunit alpha-2-like isoform X2 [Ostrea edulis]|uniref:glycine receptor subunit alpha-2-like isoform X2 n=1 Tax=Ostrea edulis TaxID=37623 RepID=UPI00209509B8|nr:glycine receptor subunit alpha-2-like isoform X2 [Ostrea edulis]
MKLAVVCVSVSVAVLLSADCVDCQSIMRTDFIQAMFDEYDSGIPPNFESNQSTKVNVGVYVNSIDSINEQSMDFTINAFVEQEWCDPRLEFYGMIKDDYFELDSKFMVKVWVPDLYFTNEKRASFHDITVPNKMLHLYKNGCIKYRLRVSVTASCPMRLHKYPMDTQTCSLYIQSFAYTRKRIEFRWKSNRPVITSNTVELPQFTLVNIETNNSCDGNDDAGDFTCIQVNFNLNRNIGFYMIQLYIPTIMIVLLSWLSFWLSVDAVPARISLGILTVLTMTTQKSAAISSLPRVSYVKAIDIWMAMCLVFVFAALLEFAFVNVMQRRQQKIVILSNASNECKLSRHL